MAVIWIGPKIRTLGTPPSTSFTPAPRGGPIYGLPAAGGGIVALGYKPDRPSRIGRVFKRIGEYALIAAGGYGSGFVLGGLSGWVAPLIGGSIASAVTGGAIGRRLAVDLPFISGPTRKTISGLASSGFVWAGFSHAVLGKARQQVREVIIEGAESGAVINPFSFFQHGGMSGW